MKQPRMMIMSLTDCCHCCFSVFHFLCDFSELSPMFEMSMIRSQHLCLFPVTFKRSPTLPTDDYKCRCLFDLNSSSNKFHASGATDLRFYLYRGGLHNTFREPHWLKERLLRYFRKKTLNCHLIQFFECVFRTREILTQCVQSFPIKMTVISSIQGLQ